jgi:uncharacterized RDD family membrane protein YckC
VNRRGSHLTRCLEPGLVGAALNSAANSAVNGLMRIRGAADTNDVYAGFWRRLLAWSIDAALLTGLYFLLAHLFGGGIEHRGGIYLFMVEPGRTATDLIVLVAWVYYAACESSVLQGTVGKQVVGIVVADANGQRLSFLRASGRHWAKALSAIPLGVGFLMAGWTAKKQAVHDLVAGTLVLDRAEKDATEVTGVRVSSLILGLAVGGLLVAFAATGRPGRADVYVVPLNEVTANDAQLVAADVHSELHVRAAALPSVEIDPSAFDSQRAQLVAEQLESAVRSRYGQKLRNGSILIAVTDMDMYSNESPQWQFVFSARDDAGVGVISLARLGSTDPTVFRSRVDKLLARHVERLRDHAPFNNDPNSVLYANLLSVGDIDRTTIVAPTTT